MSGNAREPHPAYDDGGRSLAVADIHDAVEEEVKRVQATLPYVPFHGHSHVKPLTAKQKEKEQQYESLDYEDVVSLVSTEAVAKRTERQKSRLGFIRWVMHAELGILTGIVAFFIDVIVRHIAKFKFDTTSDLAQHSFFGPFFFYVFFNVALVAVASFFVVKIEPLCAGSGIPEIKSYLNGTNIKHVVNMKTLIAKATGVLFSVAGGLNVGKEGPMIHSGAIVAANVSQGDIPVPGMTKKELEYFRNDHEKRDFVSAGAASGVAAAFGAPIGGVLFALEEAASFWDLGLTWRTFFSTMICTFTLNFFQTGTLPPHSWGHLSNPGLINFGSFEGADKSPLYDPQPGYTIVEIPFFLFLGLVGGWSGAAFNWLNTKITKYRQKHLMGPRQRFMEALFVGALTAVCSFLVPYGLPCSRLPEGDINLFDLKQFYCKDNEFSDYATVSFNTQEEAIKVLFHYSGDISLGSLVLFSLVYFFLANITYGIGVPSGLFVPCLLGGCAWGRFFGHLLHEAMPHANINPGTYALIGAASFLGGVARMTISITVIILESTNDINYGLPIMLTIMVAKLTGDRFNEGLYDIHIHLKSVPFLEYEPPEEVDSLTASDVMARPVIVLRPVEKVETILGAIQGSTHSGFPIVIEDPTKAKTSEGGETRKYMVGMILRSQLQVLLHQRVFQRSDSLDDPSNRRLTHQDFNKFYPKWPKMKRIHVTEEDHKLYINLTPYMHQQPHTVSQATSLRRTFTIFRSLGLRHLPVINATNQIVGIITRKDLTHNNIVEVLELKKHGQLTQSAQSTMEASLISMPL